MLRPDIPFARDDANRFLPWMVGLMAAITALMLLLSLDVSEWVAGQRGKVSEVLTVQLPPDTKRNAREIATQLEALPGVKTVRVLPREEVSELVKPWLGDATEVANLPLPTVIEMAQTSPGAVNTGALQQRVEELAPGGNVDGREMWVEKFSRFSAAVQAVLMVLSLCVLAGLAGMMVFTARASMKLHGTTVSLLHGLGAENGYISRQFQVNALRLALRGAVPGIVLAAGLYVTLALYLSGLDAPVLPSIGIGLNQTLLLLGLPLLCAGLSVVSVRLATMAQLKALP